ncbi:hypothetical protein HYU92_06705 [Candidatus Curtissbacteria bacterium]|nr:hypothetical protein [Candidatus Curtissbacteria bacterium]
MDKPTVLLDIDNTILDIDSLKKQAGLIIEANYGEGAQEDFWKIYGEVKKELGVVDLKEIALRFAKKRNSDDFASAIAAFLEVDFKKHLIPGAKELVDFLSKNSTLVIFSQGHEMFQRQKIEKLGLDKRAAEVIISRSKAELFPKIKEDFSPPFIIIDDRPEVLSVAKKALDGVCAVWVKIGTHAEKGEVEADFETDNLLEVISFLEGLLRWNGIKN